MKTRAGEAGKPRSIQQKSVFRKGDAHRKSHSIQQKVGAAVRLSQEQPSDEDEYSQNSDACVDGHHAAVQQKDTAHVKHLTHGAKRDTKLKYRTVVLEVPSRLPHRDRVSHSALDGRPQLTMPWQSSADQTEKKHTDIFSRAPHVKQSAKETQGSRTTQWCWRSYRKQRPHTVVLKASADHAVAEFQRPNRRQSSSQCNTLL